MLLLAVSAISREPADVAAFSDMCASHGVSLYGPDGEISRPTIAVMAGISDNIERAAREYDRMRRARRS